MSLDGNGRSVDLRRGVDLDRALRMIEMGSRTARVDDLVLVAFTDRPKVAHPAAAVRATGVELIDWLESRSVLAIRPSTWAGAEQLRLSGGSESTTDLLFDRRIHAWTVRKRILGVHESISGSIERLSVEGRFIRAVSSLEIFPAPSLESNAGVGYTSQMVPGYTLADRILQGRETSASAVEKVAHAWSLVRDELHPRLPWTRGRPSYPLIIRSRWESLPAEAQALRRLLNTPVAVNGDRSLPPLDSLLAEVTASSDLYLEERGRRVLTHGDLILDNIVVQQVGKECDRYAVRLIDPNPFNTWPGVDVGKILMNCYTRYDVAMAQSFDVEVEQSDMLLNVRYKSPAHAHRSAPVYEAIADWAISEAAANVGMSEAAALAQAGLHAVAIAPFHQVHHRQPARAMFFALEGMRLLHSALQYR